MKELILIPIFILIVYIHAVISNHSWEERMMIKGGDMMKSIEDIAKEVAGVLHDEEMSTRDFDLLDEEDKVYFIRIATHIHNSEIKARIEELNFYKRQDAFVETDIKARLMKLEELLKKEI